MTERQTLAVPGTLVQNHRNSNIFLVVFLGGIYAPQRKMPLSVWKKFLSSLNQRNPSVFLTTFIPGVIICLANTVIPRECLREFLCFGIICE